jgi:hypothetical protein
MAVPAESLRLRLIFDRRRIDQETVRELLNQMAALLSQIPAGAKAPVGELLSILPEVRRRREEPAQRSFSVYVAPGTEMEKKIAAIWGSVFALDRIGINDNFFDLGGHSILMVQTHNRLQAALGRQISIARMFQHPTISSLAKYLAGDTDAPSAAPMIQDRAKRQREAIARRRPLARKT